MPQGRLIFCQRWGGAGEAYGIRLRTVAIVKDFILTVYEDSKDTKKQKCRLSRGSNYFKRRVLRIKRQCKRNVVRESTCAFAEVK
jgi:hypothetical protein